MDVLSFVFMVLPSLLLPAGVVAYVVAKYKNKPKVYHALECFLCWMTFSLVFPHFAKKYGLIKRTWVSWVLAFLSPASWLTCLLFIVVGIGCYVAYQDSRPLDYDKLKYTSREDIIALTEIQDFPAFHYVTNSNSSIAVSTSIQFEFEEPLSASMKERISSMCEAPDNVFWKKTSDSSFLYTLNRGWDGMYCKAPRKGMGTNDRVTIKISDKGFELTYNDNWIIADMVDRDSLYNNTYIHFPEFKVINCCFYDAWTDYTCEVDMKMNSQPDKAFLEHLQDSPFFKQDEEQPDVYRYSNFDDIRFSNRENHFQNCIEVNVKTGIIHYSREKY